MKKALFSILAIAVLSFTACQSNKDYPADVKDNFMNSCIANGGAKETCGCVFEKIKGKYTYEQFREIEKKAEAGTPPADFVEFATRATADCQQKK